MFRLSLSAVAIFGVIFIFSALTTDWWFKLISSFLAISIVILLLTMIWGT